MTQATLLYPRLPASVAAEVAIRLRAATLDQIGDGATEHDTAIYGATGGVRVTREKIDHVRTGLIRLAKANGFPRLRPPKANCRKFDGECARYLLKEMDISPHEASQQGVWQFVACVMAPAIVRWRFPGKDDQTSIGRYMGGVRNTFQRLWWRAYLLSSGQEAQGTQLLEGLNEDELVQIMERPSIAGSIELAQEVAICFLEALVQFRVAGQEASKRMLLMRESQKRIMRMFSVIAFDSLERPAIHAIVQSQFLESMAAIQKHHKIGLPVQVDHLT